MLMKMSSSSLTTSPLLLLWLAQAGDSSLPYSEYRLEKLCGTDGSVSRVKMEDTAASFHLNSSLLPGSLFECHLELVLETPDSGFLVYFDSLALAQPSKGGECETDYVQFGRDILFITSYRSRKYCGSIVGSLPSPPRSNSSVVGRRGGDKVTPLSKRVYSESNDQEMDIWLQLAVPPADWPGHKTLALTVTPFLKSCRKENRKFRRCSSSSRQCIRRELFCDGRVNCALSGSKPLDEASCTSTNSPQQDSKSDHWQDSSLPTVTGLFSLGLFIAVVIGFVYKRLKQQQRSKQGHSRGTGGGGSQNHDDLLVAINSSPPRVARRAPPPPYSEVPTIPSAPAYNPQDPWTSPPVCTRSSQ